MRTWAVLGRLLIVISMTPSYPLSPRTVMSSVPATSTTHSNFVSIFNAALEMYKIKTKNDLVSHPLLSILQSCDSSEAILTTLREQIPITSGQSQNGDDRLTKWVTPTVNVLYSFSATIGGGVGLVNIRVLPREECPPNICFLGISSSKLNLCGNWCSAFGRCRS